MAPYRTNRANLLSKFRKPYAKKRKLSRGATISEGGVGGARAIMRPMPMPPPQEIKSFDSLGSSVVGGTGWTIISDGSIYGIITGGLSNQRIGKNIRVVGLVFRAAVTTTVQTVVGATSTIDGAPWSMDFILDGQCNGSAGSGGIATVGEIYNLPTLAGVPPGLGLPNPLYDSRFKFLKRVQNKDPSTPLNTIDFNMKMNTVFEYKSTTGIGGALQDLSSKNLYVTFTSPADTASTVSYVMRVLYVDA